jgi:group I intron endonuclease
MNSPAPFRGEVYLHWCPATNKGYVGQTTAGVPIRWRDQVKITRWPSNAGYLYPISNAIRKYGKDAFEHQVLAVAKTKAELDNLEKIWIVLLQTRRPTGFNLATGGEGNPGLAHTRESKEKISKNRTGKALGNKNAAGQVWTEERKQKLSQKLQGRKFSEEHNKKISVARAGKKHPAATIWNNARWANPEEHDRMRLLNTGKSMSQASKEKNRSAHLGKKASPETRAKMSAAHKGRRK